MKTTGAWMVLLSVFTCCLTAGCPDSKPSRIGTSNGGELRVLAVDPADSQEVATATAMETARVNYDYRLTVLVGFYDRIGQMEKHSGAVKELKNLREAQWFRWVNVPEVMAPGGEGVQGADERTLVELAMSARREFKNALTAMAEYYEYKDFSTDKAKIIRRVGERLDEVRIYSYFPEAELPAADLKPTEVIPEADALYEKAYKIHQAAKWPPLMPNYRKQREALDLFMTLVEKYPRSTKIAMSAYWIAEINKEYFNENLRAVRWYERAWQWDPLITEPARFQAAVIWDLRLQDKERALELYRQVLLHESQLRATNTAFANRRIEEITERR